MTDYLIIILNNNHKSSNGGDDIKSLRRQSAHFRYLSGYFKSGFWDVEKDAKENIRNIRSTISSKIIYD